MDTMRTLRTRGACILLALVVACGSDTVTSPTFGNGCSAGTITPGETMIGRLTQASCTNTYDFYSNGAPTYASYAVQLVQGKGYMFTETHIPDSTAANIDDIDPLLELWGTLPNGTGVPLGVSDDEAGTLNSTLYFIAPVTGTYRLVAGSFWGGEFGAYRLTAAECPVVATLDTAGTYALALQTSPCVKSNAGNNIADTSAFVFLSLDAAAHEQITLSAASAAFTPVWEAFGPGFDTYGHVYAESRSTLGTGNGTAGSMTMDTIGGPMTIAIGGTAGETVGAFTITLGRTPPPAPPAPGSAWSLARVAQMTMKPKPAPKSH